MKKILLAIAAVGLLIVTPACKKGDNDPFLSLKSREARLVGIYEFTSWESFNETLVEGVFSYRTNTDIKIEEGKGTQITTITSEVGAEDSHTKIKNIQVDKGELIIDKDGTWVFTMNMTLTWEEAGGGINHHYEFTEVQTITESGQWKFPDNEPDSFKSKERVFFSEVAHQAFVETTMKIVFADGSSSTWIDEKQTVTHNGVIEAFYEIDGLKNKEMILKRPKEGTKVQIEGENEPVFISLVTEGMVQMHLTQQ